MTRAEKGIFVTATDTEVGKTQVAAGLAWVARKKLSPHEADGSGGALHAEATDRRRADRRSEEPQIRLWKPVQSGVGPEFGAPDSLRLQMGSGIEQSEADIATYTFYDPLAPLMAARRAGTSIDYGFLLSEGLRRLDESDFLLVEGAGGLAVPLTERHMIADLARDLSLPLIVVARPGLGTVNHAVLTVAFARQTGIVVRGVIVNGVKDNEDSMRVAENLAMIEAFAGVPVLAVLPWMPSPGPDANENVWRLWREQWGRVVEQRLAERGNETMFISIPENPAGGATHDRN